MIEMTPKQKVPVPMDATCPACAGQTDVTEGFAGTEINCTSCGVALLIEVWSDDTGSLILTC